MAAVIGQVSLASSAVAALHRDLRSPGTTRRVTRPVKSPSPSRRVAPQGPLPPLLRDVQSQRVLFEAMVGGASSAVGEEEFEDWEPQVGPTSLCFSPLHHRPVLPLPQPPPYGQSYTALFSQATDSSSSPPAFFHLFYWFPSLLPSILAFILSSLTLSLTLSSLFNRRQQQSPPLLQSPSCLQLYLL